METINFIYKSKVEQFKEQFPELYLEIYNVGYTDGRTTEQYQYDAENPAEFDESMGPDDNDNYPQYAVPTDDSERFCMFGTWQEVYNKAGALDLADYKAGNKDWKVFMNSYKDWKNIMYIAWNPTHKQFAVESDASVIDECYPHLVNPQEKDI